MWDEGTDSRLGVGFRLGQHADFQTLVEFGPQIETGKIGNTDSKQRRQAVLDATMDNDGRLMRKSMTKVDTANRRLKNKTNSKDIAEIKDDPASWLMKWNLEMSELKSGQTPLGTSYIQRIRMI
ncbi:uncharacterized protein [Fopius arisanus]|uniref:Uncharacterized protein n=1 Tax=Fopius arisanus TaxID=64838 RepID=A0A9R1TQ84_9HYME|nr:PREDICTED: uncharacterized protein LOC105272747 [Fopius arisanus]